MSVLSHSPIIILQKGFISAADYFAIGLRGSFGGKAKIVLESVLT
jgi:hypothetical protein